MKAFARNDCFQRNINSNIVSLDKSSEEKVQNKISEKFALYKMQKCEIHFTFFYIHKKKLLDS